MAYWIDREMACSKVGQICRFAHARWLKNGQCEQQPFEKSLHKPV